MCLFFTLDVRYTCVWQVVKEVREERIRQAVKQMVSLIQGYRLGAFFSVKSLPPALVLRNILMKAPEARTDDELSELLDMTRNVKFFQKFHVPEDDRKAVCRVLGIFELTADQPVFEQGDLGDLFYIIIQGSVSVSIYDAVREFSYVVANLTSGDSFGELALMSHAPRAATIVARDECIFATLDRASFRRTLKAPHEKIQMQKLTFLMRCPIFATTPRANLLELSLVGHSRKYPRETVIIQQGDPPHSGVFFVKSGTLRVVQEVSVPGSQRSHFLVVNELSPFCMFGEHAHMHRIARTASVITNTACELLEISKFDFFRRLDNESIAHAQDMGQQYATPQALRERLAMDMGWEGFKTQILAVVRDPVRKQKGGALDLNMTDFLSQNDDAGQMMSLLSSSAALQKAKAAKIQAGRSARPSIVASSSHVLTTQSAVAGDRRTYRASSLTGAVKLNPFFSSTPVASGSSDRKTDVSSAPLTNTMSGKTSTIIRQKSVLFPGGPVPVASSSIEFGSGGARATARSTVRSVAFSDESSSGAMTDRSHVRRRHLPDPDAGLFFGPPEFRIPISSVALPASLSATAATAPGISSFFLTAGAHTAPPPPPPKGPKAAAAPKRRHGSTISLPLGGLMIPIEPAAPPTGTATGRSVGNASRRALVLPSSSDK
jgi:CRP-like cAMP-binding protein